MRTYSFLAAILLLAVASLQAERAAPRDYVPDEDGYVTAITSPASIDVDGTHVHLDGNTQFFLKAKTYTRVDAADVKFYVGQQVEVYGNRHGKEHSISAEQINLLPKNPSKIEGAAGVVDRVMEPVTPGEHLLRAAGYVIHVPAHCELTYEAPLTAETAFHTNVWITFDGEQSADGVVTARKISFRENRISKREVRLSQKADYDPAAVSPDARQEGMDAFFNGVDPKQVPPSQDAAAQARAVAIGSRLIPQYQRELPEGNPAKINFRFQVVDEDRYIGAVAWPNGIILVTHATMERLHDDSQIAAVLAFAVASVIEKRAEYLLPTGHKRDVASLLIDAVSIPVGPIFGLAMQAGNTGMGLASLPPKAMRWAQSIEVSSRESLYLMHDAGFDVYQAPLTWWTAVDIKSKGFDKVRMPYVATIYFKVLGESWSGQ